MKLAHMAVKLMKMFLQVYPALDFTATSGTTTLDGTPISWSLSADTNDLTIASSETAQSGEVVHIDDESLVDVNITNNGTIWSTENNAIAFDNTTITGTFNITNNASEA